MNYKAAFFDMDGTILDTLEDMYDSVNVTMTHFGLPPVTLRQTRAYVGNGARRLIEQAVPAGTDPGLIEEVLRFYTAWYNDHSAVKTVPYAGIPELLADLKGAGMKLAVISNKPDPTVRRLADALFPGLFETAVGERPGIRRKPAPDSVLAAMESTGFPAADCVYIGDSEVDIATAKAAGLDCISVTWGFRDPEQLTEAGASLLCPSADMLKSLLLNG